MLKIYHAQGARSLRVLWLCEEMGVPYETAEASFMKPSDEFKDDWDYTGAVDDMRFLTELGWRIANSPTMPAYHATEQFARPRARQP